MKRIIYLLALLLCFAGCKKEEVGGRVKAARIAFANNTLGLPPNIVYNGKTYTVFDVISTSYGDKQFEIYTPEGVKIIDTTLTVSGDKKYFIYQAVATDKPVLITELPPPPAGPEDPLENVTPAPEGFMKIKIKHDLALLGFEKIDVQILANFNSANDYEVYTTIPNVTTTLSSDFVMIQRPVRDGALLQNFKFRFLNSITKAPAMSGNGQVYTTYNASMGRSVYNAYVLSFSFFESGDPNDYEYNGAFHEIDADVTSK